MPSRFRITGHFEISARDDPKVARNTKRWKVPHLPVTTTPESQISLSFVIAGRFWFKGHFETSAPNDPQMTSITKRWKVPIYMLQPLPTPKFHPFRSTAIRFQVTGYFETSAPNDPKWPSALKGQIQVLYILLPVNPKFHSVPLHSQLFFFSYRPLWDKCTEWPQHDIEY